MLQMRGAGEDDRPGIAAMIRRRDAWMLARGLPDFGGGAQALAGQAGDPDFPMRGPGPWPGDHRLHDAL
jgi:hypothetical protein